MVGGWGMEDAIGGRKEVECFPTDSDTRPSRFRCQMIIKLAHKSKTYETRFEFDAITFIWAPSLHTASCSERKI